MARIFVSIGSNIEREKNLPSSLRALEKEFGELTFSSVYESEAVGFQGAPFYNMVIAFESERPIQEIGRALRAIEIQHGRSRECKKFAPRTLDLDLLLCDDMISTEGSPQQIPRDEIFRYAFVLEPLAEIAPYYRHPVTQKTYAQLWSEFDKSKASQHRVAPSWNASPGA